MMKETIVALYANPYNMVDEKTGQHSEGVSVAYLYGATLGPTMGADGSLGQRPAKGSLKTSLWGKFSLVPGVYEASFDMSIGSNGKPTLKLVDVDFISEVELNVLKAIKPQGGGNK